MADKITKEQRKRNMQAIRSQSQLENRVSRLLWRKGYRFRKNDRTLLGKPDISIKRYKVAVFIDSCFWHSCPIHGNRPKSNQEYWDTKLASNRERDQVVTQHYLEEGWTVLRIWEHEIKNDIEEVIDRITDSIEKAKKRSLT